MKLARYLTSGDSVSRVAKLGVSVAVYLVVLTGLVMLGRQVTPPDQDQALTPGGGALAAAFHVLTGQKGGTDYLLDYASAHALRTGADAYEVIALLSERVGAPWPVSHANPHPPSVLGLVLPFTYLPYESSLAAWSLAMVGVVIATLCLVEVPLGWATVTAATVAITWPGAYGIGNVVPLIGLGIALAWRFRDRPVLAGAGMALAAAPKFSGLLLVMPFLLTGRFRAVAWAGSLLAALAGLPLLFDNRVWASYLRNGVDAITLSIARGDNASLLERGIPGPVMILALGALAVALALRMGDLYWPTVWLMVAALPIAWMYSLLTLVPALARSLRHAPAMVFVVMAVAVAVGSSPSGHWPIISFALIVALAFIALWHTRATGFAPPAWMPPGLQPGRLDRSTQ